MKNETDKERLERITRVIDATFSKSSEEYAEWSVKYYLNVYLPALFKFVDEEDKV